MPESLTQFAAKLYCPNCGYENIELIWGRDKEDALEVNTVAPTECRMINVMASKLL